MNLHFKNGFEKAAQHNQINPQTLVALKAVMNGRESGDVKNGRLKKQAGIIGNAVSHLTENQHVIHGAELAGLGTLAAYPIKGIINGPKEHKGREIVETAGLGMLAAPSIAHFGKALLTKKV